METIPDNDSTVKCLCCEKNIRIDQHGCLDSAGYVYISFHYGSKHDQCGSGAYDNDTRIEKLLACDTIEAYICDDCFEKKQELMKGFVKVKQVVNERKV